ncbi:MAG: ABC transporter substrate-binding protein [Oscillospiraceae bacterium]|nr:ABC transporter substrate-binding protein [Oscillospiraceae bacterium]
MKKRLIALALAALMCAGLSACGSKEGSTPQSPSASSAQQGANQQANAVTVGIAQDLDNSLDPHKAVAAGTKEVMFNVFEGLVKPTSNGDLTPAVAESYTVSEDHLTYTFTLREGVKFHNGDTVTAEDVVYSIQRVAAATETGVVQVEALSIISDITAPDEGTVVITLSEPSNEFLANLTVAILPADYTEQDTAPVGTGPFRFVSRSAQESIVMEKFEDYWGEKAYLDQVTFRIIENAEGLLMGLQSGAIDICSHLSSTQTAQLSADEFNIEQGNMNLVQAVYLNNAVPPLDSLQVRQALCLAVNKQEIIDMAFDGYGTPIGSSMYPAFGKYFDESLTGYYAYDTEQAKALLADAGYPNGFELTITVPSNYQPHMDTAQVVAEQLKLIGVNVTIQPVEWETWLSDVYVGRNFQATLVGVDASTMTARALLERFTSTYSKNFINYSNAEYDQLFAQAQACYDDAQQTGIYKAMLSNLTENAANVYIQDLADLVAVRKGLEGLTFYPIYVLDLSTIRYSA